MHKHKKEFPIGQKIRNARILRRLTQTEFGKLLNISKQAVSRLEQSWHINPVRLEQAASVLGFSVQTIQLCDTETILALATQSETDFEILRHQATTDEIHPFVTIVQMFEKILQLKEDIQVMLERKVDELQSELKELRQVNADTLV